MIRLEYYSPYTDHPQAYFQESTCCYPEEINSSIEEFMYLISPEMATIAYDYTSALHYRHFTILSDKVLTGDDDYFSYFETRYYFNPQGDEVFPIEDLNIPLLPYEFIRLVPHLPYLRQAALKLFTEEDIKILDKYLGTYSSPTPITIGVYCLAQDVNNVIIARPLLNVKVINTSFQCDDIQAIVTRLR